jgi:ABC-type branched-subunit amino acid transport system ATPase component
MAPARRPFFNCLTGLYKNESGHFVFDGVKLEADAPHKAAEVGIARTFQNIRLFGNMTAIENVMVGRHLRTHAGVFGAITRNSATRAEEAAIARRPKNCCTTWEFRSGHMTTPSIFPTAISGASRLPVPWPPNPSCSRSTSRLRA